MLPGRLCRVRTWASCTRNPNGEGPRSSRSRCRTPHRFPPPNGRPPWPRGTGWFVDGRPTQWVAPPWAGSGCRRHLHPHGSIPPGLRCDSAWSGYARCWDQSVTAQRLPPLSNRSQAPRPPWCGRPRADPACGDAPHAVHQAVPLTGCSPTWRSWFLFSQRTTLLSSTKESYENSIRYNSINKLSIFLWFCQRCPVRIYWFNWLFS